MLWAKRLQRYKVQAALRVQESWFLVSQSLPVTERLLNIKQRKRRMSFLHLITPTLNLSQSRLEGLLKCRLPGPAQRL